MKHLKNSICLLLLIVFASCKTATDPKTEVYTRYELDSIVALELQKQVDAIISNENIPQLNQELVDLKLEKFANDKFIPYLQQHDSGISQNITLVGIIFTILITIVGILIPMTNNKKIENKLDEHKRELEESKKELQSSKRQVEESEKELDTLKNYLTKIRDEVTSLKDDTYKSKIEAERAARRSMFSEMLTRTMNEVDFDKKMEMFSKLIEDYPENEFLSQSHCARGMFYFDSKKYENAIEDFSASLSIDSNNASTYYYRGFAFEDNGDKDKAISDYTSAISINPNYAEALYRRGNNTRSIKDLEKAIAISPNFVKAYYVLGTIYEDNNDKNSALDYMSEGKRRARFEGDLQMINQFEKAITRLRSKMQ